MLKLGRVLVAAAVAAGVGIGWAPTSSASIGYGDYGDCYADNGAPFTATDASGNPEPSIPVPPCVPLGATLAVSPDQDLSTTVDPLTAATYDVTQLAEIVPNVGAAGAGVGVPTGVGDIGGIGGNVCDPAYTYKVTKRYADSVTVGWDESDYNQGPNVADFSFTSGDSVSKSFAFTASFTAEEGVIFAGVKETYGIDVQTTKATTKGNTATAKDVKPGWTATGKYGIYRAVTDGDYSYLDRNCNVKDYGNVRAYSPYHVGWKLYETQGG